MLHPPTSNEIDGIPGNDKGGTLQATWAYEYDLKEVLKWMKQDIYVTNDEGVKVEVPRFGLLTLLLRSTPVLMFDHPVLKQHFGTTACTDGINIFFCEDLYKKVVAEELESGDSKSGIVPVILHELMHKLKDHCDRMHAFTPTESNIATDRHINSLLQISYPEIKWVEHLTRMCISFRPGEKERYSTLSEETIARQVREENQLKRKNPKQNSNQQDSQPQQPGQKGKKNQENQQKGGGKGDQKPQPGQPGQQGQGGVGEQNQGDEHTDPGSEQKNSSEQGNKSDKGSKGDNQQQGSDFGAEGDNHFHTIKDTIEAFKDAGLEEHLERLSLPSNADDVEQIGAVKEAEKLRKVDAVNRGADYQRQASGRMPGGPVLDAAKEYVKGFSKGKITWQMAVRKAVHGDGMKFQYTMDDPGPYFVMDEVTELIGNPLYIGAEIPAKSNNVFVFLFDTSGSVSRADLVAGLSEAMTCKRGNSSNDEASEIVILFADTELRDGYIEVNEENYNDVMKNGINVFGRGGTDLNEALRSAMCHPVVKKKKIEGIVFVTDGYDTPPTKASLGLGDKQDMRIVYLIVPGGQDPASMENFYRTVSEYSTVVPIREGVEVDMSIDGLRKNNKSPNSTKAGSKGKF